MIKFNKLFNQFEKNRDNILKNKEYLSILIYFILLFIIDYSGIIDYYDQNVLRRFINMNRRTDQLSYKNKLNPYCEKYDKMLNKNDLIKLQSIKIPENKDFSFFSRKNTTTHQCCENYSDDEIKTIEYVSEKIRQKYEKNK